MKRNYEEPEMEVLLLEFADVMNQSTPTSLLFRIEGQGFSALFWNAVEESNRYAATGNKTGTNRTDNPKSSRKGWRVFFLSGRNEYAAVYRPGAGQSHTCSTSGQDKKV